jgi:hypothetical protein
MKKTQFYAAVCSVATAALIYAGYANAKTDNNKVPDNVTISNSIQDIDVVNEKGQKINTNVSVNGKTILLAFTEPVAPNTKLKIDLNKIKRRNLGNGSSYSFSAREVGIDAEIPIGVAWFRFY